MKWTERWPSAMWRRDNPASTSQGFAFAALPKEFLPSLLGGLARTVLRSPSARVFVLRGGTAAFAHVVAEPGRDHWFIARLQAPRDPQAAARLLDTVARAAGVHGVVRLHTLVPDDPDELAWWHAAGFVPFRRTLLLAGTVDSEPPSDRYPLRVQGAVDAWAVQRLYERVTPRPIQFAEARSRATWHVGRRAGWQVRGYLLPGDGELRAYCRVRSRRGRHLVEVLAAETASEEIVLLVQTALGHCARPGDRALLLMPEEQQWLVRPLEQAGFALVGSRVWLARYTVRRVRARQPLPETARLGVLAETPRVYCQPDRGRVAVIEQGTRS